MTRRKKIIIGGCIFLFCLWLVSQISFIFCVLNSPSKMAAVDAVVVFTGGPQRLEKAIDLYDGTPAKRLFITSVSSGYTGRRKEDLNITLDRTAKSTKDNAKVTAAYVLENDIKSVLLVTAAYHIPRSVKELSEAAPHLLIIPHPVYPYNFKKENWYKKRKGLKFMFMENLKFRCVQIEYFFKNLF